MTRGLDELSRAPLDLLVVGGGVHGLFSAWEAARRGLRVALVERDDFGSGLSFNHQRTVHGGLRALQTGNVFKARHQVAERRRWAEMAPLHVHPLSFVVGTYRGSPRSRGRLRLGLALYDSIAGSRNDGLQSAHHLPASRVVATDEIMARFPSIPTRGLSGGATWSDYQAVHPDRLNWLIARAAMDAGAHLVNHADVVAGLRERGRVVGARVSDRLHGQDLDIRARMTLLTAGSGLPELYERFDLDDRPPRYVAAANVLVDRVSLADGLAAPDGSGRMLTAVPWGGATLVGTFQHETPGSAGDPFPLGLDDMLAAGNRAFPALEATRADVLLVHRGWTPAVVRDGRADLLAEPVVVPHRLRGAPGLVSLVGVKFTTARTAALEGLAVVAEEAGWRWPAIGERVELPFGAAAAASTRDDVAAIGRKAGLADAIVDHLLEWYGDEAREVIALARDRNLLARLDAASPVIEAEVAHATLAARALRLADAVLRRTALGGARRPSHAALARAADVMGDLLGWDSFRRVDELAAVEDRYRL